MSGITGRWELEIGRCRSLRKMIQAMGRRFWEVGAIEKAKESLRYYHYAREPGDPAAPHEFRKDVLIYLDSIALAAVSRLPGFSKVNQVQYRHDFTDGARARHPDDEKQFGPCESETAWTPALAEAPKGDPRGTLEIVWLLRPPRGGEMRLRARHTPCTAAPDTVAAEGLAGGPGSMEHHVRLASEGAPAALRPFLYVTLQIEQPVMDPATLKPSGRWVQAVCAQKVYARRPMTQDDLALGRMHPSAGRQVL